MRILTIGRSSENNIVINNSQVSRHHAQLVQHDDGKYSIIDLNSTNGTFVNGYRVYGEQMLKKGDRVCLGTCPVWWENYVSDNKGTKPSSSILLIVLAVAVALAVVALCLFLIKDIGENKLQKQLSADNVTNSYLANLTGIWIDKDYTGKLDLKQRGNQLSGYYYTTDHGCDLDDPSCARSITGTISGNIASISFYSPRVEGDMTVTLKFLSDKKIEWINVYGNSVYMYKQESSDVKKTSNSESKITEKVNVSSGRSKVSLEQMKVDLVGRRLTEQDGGYHYEDWAWEIEYDDIKKIEILQDRYSDKEYECEIYLLLQAEGSAHEANVRLNYVKNKNDMWKLDLVKCNKIQIVKTGRYDDCITATRTGRDYEYQLQLTNHSDIPLVVGGKIYLQSTKQWVNFSQVVDGASTEVIGGLFTSSVLDFQIDFVEKP